MNGALVDVDADVVEMFVLVECELARVETFRHRIADLQQSKPLSFTSH